jgi:transposase
MARTYPWKVSDALWERVEPLIPVRPPHPKGGRPAAPDRQMFSAIIYGLRTGIGMECLAQRTGSLQHRLRPLSLVGKPGVLSALVAGRAG